MLGFGESDKPEIDYTLDLYVTLLDRFLAELNLTEVTLVGNCMGSATALAYASARPDRLRAVVAVNILTKATICGGVSGPLVRIAARSPRLGRLIGRMPMPGPMARAMVATQHSGRLATSTLTYLRGLYRDRRQPRVLMSIAANMGGFGTIDEMSGVDSSVPVLVIWGEQNRVLPAKDGATLCQALRPTMERTVPGGHLVMLEHPTEINDAIESFTRTALR
jgi:pimeloyl-ACP methyl ester carboxylesterase